jgi:hypothetical protein
MAERRLKRPRDPIQLGKPIVDIATGQVEDAEKTDKDPTTSALGRIGGLKGGVVPAERLSPERRSEIARNAAKARYARRHSDNGDKD